MFSEDVVVIYIFIFVHRLKSVTNPDY